MSITTVKRRFQAVLAGLLVLYLTPAAMPTQWLFDAENSGAGSEAVFFLPGFANSAGLILANGTTRNRINGFGELIKAALIPGQTPIVFARKPLSFLFKQDVGASFPEDGRAIPVRAPPCHHCFQS